MMTDAMLQSMRKRISEARSQDEYQRQGERQASGQPCEHCDSVNGHLTICPLFNRQSAETMNAWIAQLEKLVG